MKILAILGIFIGMLAMYIVNFEAEKNNTPVVIATNFIIFREAVHKHVFKDNNKQAGEIDTSLLNFPSGFKLLRTWKARITDSQCVVFGQASDEEKGFILTLLNNSAALTNKNLPSFVTIKDVVSIVNLN